MKVVAKQADILNWLYAPVVVANTGVKNDHPDIGNITIAVKNNALYGYAHNGYVAVQTKPCTSSDVKFEAEGEVTLKATDLFNYLNSFDKDTYLVLELKGTEFVVSVENDDEETSSLPTLTTPVIVPTVATKFDKQLSIKKDVLLNLMNKVIFAMGYEERRPQFLYWMLRTRDQKARSVCGDGRRFAIYEIEGHDLFNSNGDMDILIYKNHNPVIQKLLEKLQVDSVHLYEYLNTKNSDLANQTVLSTDKFDLIMVGHDPGLDWVDENKFLTRTNKFQFTTKVSDWKQVLTHLKSTENADVRKQNLMHHASLEFDNTKKVLHVKSEVLLKMNRKVPIVDGNDSFSYACLSKYIVEVLNLASSDSYIQWEFTSAQEAALVRMYALSNVSNEPLEQMNLSTGVKETHTIFFASYNKNG